MFRTEVASAKCYYEHSEYPFYTQSRYTRSKEGKGVFVTDQVPVSSPGGIFNLEFNLDLKLREIQTPLHYYQMLGMMTRLNLI